MNKDIKVLSKLIVKESNKLEAVHNKHHKRRARILKRAIMLNGKLVKAIGSMFPLMSDKDIDKKGWQFVDWMESRMKDRYGRIEQNPVSRTERRLLQRGVLVCGTR